MKSNPLDYFLPMLHINEAIESRDYKTNNLFPVTTSHTPGSIQLDSSVLSSIFKINHRRLGSLSDNHEYIWGKVFKMSDKSFRSFEGKGLNPAAARQYAFAYMMHTDGVAASLIFRRIDLFDVPQQINGPLKYHKKGHTDTGKKKKMDIQYLEDIFKNEELVKKWRLDRRKIIGIDPGKINLIQCADGTGKNANLFSYTYFQRRFEKRSKFYDTKRKRFKEISGLDIQVEETNLSTENSKSVYYRDYKRYFKKKLNYIVKVKEFYSDYFFKKLKLQVYQNTRKSEAKMINNFKRIYGPPENVLICIGDYEQRKHMKYRPPSIGAGIRKIFRRHHFMIFLIDEFRTSMWCSHCGCENEKFMYHRNKKHRPKREDVEAGYRKPFHMRVLSHGLLRCKNVQGCGLKWNRDVNAAKNIFHLAELIVQGEERVQHLSRNRNNDVVINQNPQGADLQVS